MLIFAILNRRQQLKISKTIKRLFTLENLKKALMRPRILTTQEYTEMGTKLGNINNIQAAATDIKNNTVNALKMPITLLDKTIVALDSQITAMAKKQIIKELNIKYQNDPIKLQAELVKLDDIVIKMINKNKEWQPVTKVTDQNAFKIAYATVALLAGGPIALLGIGSLAVKGAVLAKDMAVLNANKKLCEQYNTTFAIAIALLDREAKLQQLQSKLDKSSITLPEVFFNQLANYKQSDNLSSHQSNKKLSNIACIIDLANIGLSLSSGINAINSLPQNALDANAIKVADNFIKEKSAGSSIESLTKLPKTLQDIEMTKAITKLNEMKNLLKIGDKPINDLRQILAVLSAENIRLNNMIDNPSLFGLDNQNNLQEDLLIAKFQKERGKNLDYKPFQNDQSFANTIAYITTHGFEIMARSLFQKTEFYQMSKINDDQNIDTSKLNNLVESNNQQQNKPILGQHTQSLNETKSAIVSDKSYNL